MNIGKKIKQLRISNDLTLEECAFLAGINHTPNSYNVKSFKSLSKYTF